MVESKTTFNLMEEHPSHKYMVMTRRKHILIPCISSVNLLPNIKDLNNHHEASDKGTTELRERYAIIVMLLFYPFRSIDDLHIDDSYWKKYREVIAANGLSKKSLEVIQNIQDVSYNCSNIAKVKDELETTTIFTPHESDSKMKCKEDEVTTDVNELAEMFKQLDDTGLEDSDPNKRSLSIIGKRHTIVNQELPLHNLTLPDITNIPDGIHVGIKGIPVEKKKASNTTGKDAITSDDGKPIPDTKNDIDFCMIIDILTEAFLNQMGEDAVTCQDTTDLLKSVKDVSFESVIKEYTLDFKQSIAFEIMASSFLLKSLNVGNVSEDVLESFFDGNDEQRKSYARTLSGLRKYLIDQGGHNDLIMFLSGMGGTGKSEVIKAFVHFAKNISHAFGWKYDNDVIKITALTGAAACEIPNGRTLHSQACLSSQKISQKQKDTWVYTKMLIIDEVSFLDEDNLRKLDKHMRKLKEMDVIFGGVHMVFVGDFFKCYQSEVYLYLITTQFNLMLSIEQYF